MNYIFNIYKNSIYLIFFYEIINISIIFFNLFIYIFRINIEIGIIFIIEIMYQEKSIAIEYIIILIRKIIYKIILFQKNIKIILSRKYKYI